MTFCWRIFANNQLSACLPGLFSLSLDHSRKLCKRLWCRKLRLTGAATETTGTTLCLLLLLLLLGSKALLTDWQHKLWELAWCYLLTVGSTYVPTFRCLGSCGRGEVRWSPSAGCVCVWLSWRDLSFFRQHRPKLLQREADGPPYSRGARPRNAHAPLFCRIYADWFWMNFFFRRETGNSSDVHPVTWEFSDWERSHVAWRFVFILRSCFTGV